MSQWKERARYLHIGCGSCDYEEADGSLIHYCAKCSHAIYGLLYEIAAAPEPATTDKVASQDAVRALMELARDFRVKYWRDRSDEKRDCATLESAIRAALQASRSAVPRDEAFWADIKFAVMPHVETVRLRACIDALDRVMTNYE